MTDASGGAPIRVVVVDDKHVVRTGFQTILDTQPDIEVVGEAANGEEAVAVAVSAVPDVVVMDLHMPGLNGIHATRRIVASSPRTAVLVLTMFSDDDSLFAAMRAGARGYLLKGAGQVEIVQSIQAVARGEAVFGPAVANRVLAYFSGPPPAPAEVFPELTDREREVLELLARGELNAAIARRLGLSPKTVRNHVSNIFTKLQVADRAQAVIRAREAGLGNGSS